MGYPSSALLDLSELQDGYAFEKGSPTSDLFAVSFAVFSFYCNVGDSGCCKLWFGRCGPLVAMLTRRRLGGRAQWRSGPIYV